MNNFSGLWKRLLDFLLLGTFLVLIFVPSLRAPIMGAVQQILLKTGLFNANVEAERTNVLFDYSLELVDHHGRVSTVEELKGDAALFINVWATWCPPCRAEMPDIARLYQDMGGEVVFLMISVDDEQAKAIQWIEDNDFPFPIYFFNGDSKGGLAYRAIPTTWVVDTQGFIRYQHSGMAQYDTEKFRDFLISL